MFKRLRFSLASARMDAELQQILTDHERVRESAHAIREFLLKVLAESENGLEKFSDEVLIEAAELLDEHGPGAFYWMADIAAQMAILAQASLAEIPTNVSVELGKSASAEQIVKLVVQV
jgi:hypothetical protein